MRRHGTRGLKALLGLWLLWAVVFPLLGERVTPWGDLVTRVEAGRVTAVRVVDGMPRGAVGTSTTTIHWRDGWMRRVTEVREHLADPSAASGDESASTPASSLDDVPTIEGRVPDLLHATRPGLRVDEVQATGHRSHSEALGWRAPAWLGLTAILLWGTTLGAFLASRDEPPYATRWGWGWWILSPASLVALVLWLVAMIRAEAVGRPAQHRGRLTGGWSLILSWLFAGAVASAVGLR